MNKIVVLVFLICGSFILVKSQSTTPPSRSQPLPSQPQNDASRPQTVRKSILDASFTFSNPITLVSPLYRKPTKKELQAISPSEEDLKKYAEFLEEPKTGLFRMIPDMGCPQDIKIVDASENCLKYSLPGAGAAFSFRKKNYQIWRLSDFVYKDSKFLSVGLFQQGIFLDVGDVELEKITADIGGLKFMNDYVPLTKSVEAYKEALKFIKGVTVNNYSYSSIIPAKVNSTYVLRSIAYRGPNFRSVKGIKYNEFDFDERKDVVVAFRVIKKDEDGSLIILWKEISRKDSPKLVLDKKEKQNNITPNNFVAKN